MKGVNKVIIVGTLGRDPEVSAMPSGDYVCNLAVATSESWKDKTTGQPVEKTEWHRIVAFGRLAEIMGEYLRKGSKVYLEGQLQTRKWQDKQSGQDRYSTEIKVSQMQMLGDKPQGGQQAPANTTQRQAPRGQSPGQSRGPDPGQAPAGNFDDFDDDIPF